MQNDLVDIIANATNNTDNESFKKELSFDLDNIEKDLLKKQIEQIKIKPFHN